MKGTTLKQNEAQGARAESTHKGELIGAFIEVPLVEFKYLVFTRMPGESYRRRLRSLLTLAQCTIFVVSNIFQTTRHKHSRLF